MKRSSLLLVIVLLAGAALVGGCGGSSVATDLAGIWSGTFTTSTSQEGTMRLTISPDGVVGGTFTNSTAGVSGTIIGSINDAGHLTGTIIAIGADLDSALTGTLTQQANGHLTGTLTQASGSVTLTVDLS